MNVLLGVTGGIAAYKAAGLTSTLVKAGHAVRVVMTPAATEFVGPITFEALCDHPVMVDAWETGGSQDGVTSVRHISWATWAGRLPIIGRPWVSKLKVAKMGRSVTRRAP